MALLGTTQKLLKVLAKKEGADVSRIIRNLKRRQNKNFKWKLDEGKGGSIKLYSVNYSSTPKKEKKEKKTKKEQKPSKLKEHKTRISKKKKSSKKTRTKVNKKKK